MAKYAAFGTKILRGAVEIPQVLSISGPAPTMDTIDVMTHDSVDGWEEILLSTLRSGEGKISSQPLGLSWVVTSIVPIVGDGPLMEERFAIFSPSFQSSVPNAAYFTLTSTFLMIEDIIYNHTI